MSKFILGKKIGMTNLFRENGGVLGVTVIQAGPNTVVQVKTKDNDGYDAVQIGFEEAREHRVTKPLRGHSRPAGGLFKHLREFHVSGETSYQVGERLDAGLFEEGELVQVSAQSIGRGFQGVVKRHGFAGGPASHGHKNVMRRPGSIGSAFPQRVLRGLRMAGRMGNARVTIKNIPLVRIDKERNLLFIEGSVPGKKGGLVEVMSRP